MIVEGSQRRKWGESLSFGPSGLLLFLSDAFTQGLRAGLHSFAASRLWLGEPWAARVLTYSASQWGLALACRRDGGATKT